MESSRVMAPTWWMIYDPVISIESNQSSMKRQCSCSDALYSLLLTQAYGKEVYQIPSGVIGFLVRIHLRRFLIWWLYSFLQQTQLSCQVVSANKGRTAFIVQSMNINANIAFCFHFAPFYFWVICFPSNLDVMCNANLTFLDYTTRKG